MSLGFGQYQLLEVYFCYYVLLWEDMEERAAVLQVSCRWWHQARTFLEAYKVWWRTLEAFLVFVILKLDKKHLFLFLSEQLYEIISLLSEKTIYVFAHCCSASPVLKLEHFIELCIYIFSFCVWFEREISDLMRRIYYYLIIIIIIIKTRHSHL